MFTFATDTMACRFYDKRNPSYHEISAAIRLGERYESADSELRTHSMEYPKYYFSGTLEGWTKLHKAIDSEAPLPGWNDFKEVDVINLT